jgi:hypothetical protein
LKGVVTFSEIGPIWELLKPEFGLQAMLSDTSGQVLDARESELRKQFGIMGNRGQARGIPSAMSKIASFLAPHAFVAYDQFCQRGLNRVLERSPSYKCGSYREYISDINRILSGNIGARVRSACADKYPSAYAAKRDRFHRRVLDVSLMRLGDRAF